MLGKLHTQIQTSSRKCLVLTNTHSEIVVHHYKYKIIDVLKNNNNVMQSVELFQNVSTYVIDNSGNTPNYSTIHNTGHDGGQFLFFPIK